MCPESQVKVKGRLANKGDDFKGKVNGKGHDNGQIKLPEKSRIGLLNITKWRIILYMEGHSALPDRPGTATKEQIMIHTEIRNLPAALSESLSYLDSLRTSRMAFDDRMELTYGTLLTITEHMCDTVTDWSEPRPRMPLSTWQAWAAARKLAEGWGDELWKEAGNSLRRNLVFGRACYVQDIA